MVKSMNDMKQDMTGKICLVTGASRGIGFQTALGLASKGAHVIMASHNQERGESARQRINTAMGKNSTDFILVDLASQEDIRKFTETIKERYDHLDVLVNNAGGLFLRRKESVDSIEMTFALNHLNYFMTTLLLMNTILSAEAPRIVNVSSRSHRGEKMRFDDLQFEKGYSAMQAYGQSKLANLLFTYELSRRLKNTNVTVNALHPGFVNTHFAKQNGPVVRFFMNIVHFLLARSPEKGAETPIYLASSPEVEGVTGKYFFDKQPIRSSQASYDRQAAQQLWQVSERMCNLEASRMDISALEIPTALYEHAQHAQ